MLLVVSFYLSTIQSLQLVDFFTFLCYIVIVSMFTQTTRNWRYVYMKKENKTRFIAVKKCFSTRSEAIKDFICIFLAFFIAFLCAEAIFSLPTNDEMVACKEELTSYLASPSRYAVNTDMYTLKISNEGTTLSINNSLGSCTAVFDDTTNTYNYTSHRSILVAILGMFSITFIFGIIFFFVFEGIIAIVSDISKWISKHYKEFRKEYLLNKAEAELNITHEEAEEYAKQMVGEENITCVNYPKHNSVKTRKLVP